MDRKQLTDKLFNMKAKDEQLSGQLKQLQTAIADGLAEAATLQDPDVEIADAVVEIYHQNKAQLPTIPPYENLVVKVDGVEIKPDAYVLVERELTLSEIPPEGAVITVSYFHPGSQAEIDAILAFYPDLLSSEYYYERLAYWQAVLAALEGF